MEYYLILIVNILNEARLNVTFQCMIGYKQLFDMEIMVFSTTHKLNMEIIL